MNSSKSESVIVQNEKMRNVVARAHEIADACDIEHTTETYESPFLLLPRTPLYQ